MKKFILCFILILALPLVTACLCLDLFSLGTGIEPFKENFSGAWHSDTACGEDETDEPYRWGVNLAEDATGWVTGTIYFHDCPGGGAVTYAVEGQHNAGEMVLFLKGTRIDGRYILFGNSKPEQDFEIMFGAAPQPNFTE